MSKIAETFHKLKMKKQGALIGYVVAGDHKPELTPKIADALIKGGVDILELGLPFSDPIADGPTIQAASARALAAGTTPVIVLETVKAIKEKHDLPIVVMTYYNPVFKMGLEKFFALAKACKVDGTIIPDLPFEEAGEYKIAAASGGVDTVFLAAPSTSDKRLVALVGSTSGFLYLVSRFGVTGARTQVEASTISLINHVKQFTAGRVPLAVGFGVSRPGHVRDILAAGADGVIVGSAFVNIISKNLKNEAKMQLELKETARELKESTVNI